MRKEFLLFSGFTLLFIAIVDQQIGSKNDRGNWIIGPMLGLVFIVAGFLFFSAMKKTENLKKISLKLSDILRYFTPARLVLFTASIIVILLYIWFVQPNNKNARDTYNYYSELAIGFKAGNLYLAETPSPALLALDNPYDYFLRKQLNIEDFPWDVSLYKNKFYIYWGPAPSLILTLFSKTLLSHIGDHYVVLAFACGLFLYSVLLVASFWKTSLQRMPIWMMGVLILVLGLSTPITIMLRDSRVYEAAIFGCQFFFIGGCYWAYSSISGNKPVLWKLILGSIHWAFALGTRITVLPVIFFTAVATIIYIFKVFKTSTPKSYLPILAALGMPLLLAMAGLSWYNWARFESIFEFGIRYQLTNVDYNLFKESFSPRHITGNIYNYFAHPFDLRRKFPFIERIEFLPSNDRLAGLLFLCPYLLLAFAPLFRIFGNFRASQKDLAKQSETKSSEGWLIMIFAGSTIIAVSTILSFYFVTMRYMEDFMPSLMLLTTILLGREFQLIDRNKPLWKNLTYTTVAFALITISANLLIAIPRSGTIFMVDLLNSASKLLGLK